MDSAGTYFAPDFIEKLHNIACPFRQPIPSWVEVRKLGFIERPIFACCILWAALRPLDET